MVLRRFLLQVQIDNDKCHRTRDARLSGSGLVLSSLCSANGTARGNGTSGTGGGGTTTTVTTNGLNSSHHYSNNSNSNTNNNSQRNGRHIVDALGNSLPPLSPQSNINNNNNNNSTINTGNMSPNIISNEKASSPKDNKKVVPMTPSGKMEDVGRHVMTWIWTYIETLRGSNWEVSMNYCSNPSEIVYFCLHYSLRDP